MKRFMGRMPSSCIEIKKKYKDQYGSNITIEAGPYGWTILYGSNSKYKDEVKPSEDNFKEAYAIITKDFELELTDIKDLFKANLNKNDQYISSSDKEDENERLKVGDIVQHFKRTMKDHEDKNLYTYKILAFAEHTETKEKLVIYQALYSNKSMGVNYGIYARPYDMFMSEVDKDKYPYTNQKYRFELLS